MKQKRVLILVVGIIAFVLCPIALAKLHKWNKRMQELSKTLSELLPELTKEANTPASYKVIERDAKKLATLSHGLNVHVGGESLLPPDADPSIGLISDLFERQVKRANAALAGGHTDYAKGLLRGATTYCIACHSRNNSGPDFPSMTLDSSANTLSRLEKAQLLAATRQFDAALDAYTQIVSDATFLKTRPIEWERATRQLLMVAVRVKQDPARALTALAYVLSSPSTPEFTRRNATAWKEALLKWTGEISKSTTTEEGLYRESLRLFNEGKAAQNYPADHSGDVYYLRATAKIHELLHVAPNGTHASEALLLAGMSYEVLNDPTLAPLDGMYFESCIRRSPHTSIAWQCFEHYEQSLYTGYSGSGGFFIPSDVVGYLNELKDLAKVKSK